MGMHVKKGDTVVVIAGDYKNKVGEVKSVYPKTGRISVEGVNFVTKHIKPTNEGEKGKISRYEGVIHQSNVMHWSIDKQVRSRTGHKLIKGKKFRYLKATGEILGVSLKSLKLTPKISPVAFRYRNFFPFINL